MQEPIRNVTRHFMVAIAVAAAVAGLFTADYTLSSASAARPNAAPRAPATPDIAGGDSRVNDYRLERDSCCAGSL